MFEFLSLLPKLLLAPDDGEVQEAAHKLKKRMMMVIQGTLRGIKIPRVQLKMAIIR
jgi:hypothetical protein